MNVHEMAFEFAKALTHTPEFVNYTSLIDKACRNEQNRALYDEYSVLRDRYDAAARRNLSESFSDEDMDRLNLLTDKLLAIPDFKKAIDARGEYMQVFNDVMLIINGVAGQRPHENK